MKIYFGLDGGASSTRAILIDEDGKTLNKKKLNKGTNLKVYEGLANQRISDLILSLCNDISISIEDISAFGFGLAAVSYERGRELLFKELDRLNIAERSVLINDAEAAYKICCQDDVGILVTVGTGVICIAKNSSGDFVRIAGKGHDKTDIGSGYWIGKEVLLKLAFNEAIINEEPDLLELNNLICDKFNKNNFQDALNYISEDQNSLKLKASIAKEVLSISNKNEIALSILQEATYNVSDYIIDLNQMLDYDNSNELILFANGSIINSPIYRKSLNDSLSFHYSNINWISSKISAAYGSAMIASLSKDKVVIKVQDIIKGDYLVSC